MKYINFFKEFFLKDEKIKTIIIFIMMLFAMLLETFSIGALVPLFTLFSEPETYEKYQILKNYSQNDLIIYLTLFIFLVFTFKTIFMAFLNRLQANFSYSVMARISSKLFEYYSSRIYSLSSKKDSSRTLRNIIREPSLLVGGIFLPIFTILTEVFIIIGVLVLLLIYSPSATIFVICFLLITSGILLGYTRPKLRGLGKEVQKFESKRIKQVTYSLSGAKDLVIANLEEVFLNFFKSYTNQATSNLAKQAFYKQITRTLLEYFSILAICALIIFLIFMETEPLQILSLVGIYLIAFFRILPASNKIIININTLSFNNATLSLLTDELKKTSKPASISKKDFNNEKIIEDWVSIKIDNISFTYENSDTPVIKEFSHVIDRNDFCAITGKSGSGKSTLVDIIIGIIEPNSGLIQTKSKKCSSEGFAISNDKVAYVPQKTFLLDESILVNITLQDYYEDKINHNYLDMAIEMSCLQELISEIPNGINYSVGEEGIALSGGQIQRIGLARALYRNPDLLILDEATSALDYENEEKIMKNLLSMQENLTLLFISHSENILKCFNKIIKLD
tara:strand:+ start:11708 stop:13405 length:1698 start_codon:yes stop_codon:yes gene_type:complete